MKTFSRSMLFALLLIGAMPAHAFCGASTTGVNFGPYNPLIGGNIDSTGSVTFWCLLDSNHSYTIGLSGGQSGNPNARRMTNTTAGLSNEHIPYRLSKPNSNGGCSYTNNWGANGSERVSGAWRPAPTIQFTGSPGRNGRRCRQARLRAERRGSHLAREGSVP